VTGGLFLRVILLVSLTGTYLQPSAGQTDMVVQEPSPVLIRFGGDCLLTNYYEEAVGDDIHRAFRELDLFRTADISMVNLECPITTRGRRVHKPFNFRMHPQYIDVIKSAGITIVNVANNHIFDYGSIGLFDTISYLDSAGIFHVGAGRNRAEARRPAVVAVRGKRIGFLGYYGGGEAPLATEHLPGVADRNIAVISADIRSLRDRDSVDYLVVNLHWGTEKAPIPDRGQITFARSVIDSGADAVIGHHPHVLQGIEKYKNGIIVYSLGNLMFGGNSRSSYDTGIFEIRLSAEGPEFQFIPIRVSEWKASSLDGPEAAHMIAHVKKLSSMFPRPLFNEKESK